MNEITRRKTAVFLCLLMVLQMFSGAIGTAKAEDRKVEKNKSISVSVGAAAGSFNVFLKDLDPTKYTGKTTTGCVSGAYQKNSSQTFSVSYKENASTTKTASGTVVFKDSNGNTWTVNVSQSKKAVNTPKPTATSTPKPTATKKPTPSPTKKPTNSPTPRPKLAASPTSMSFESSGGTKTVTLSNRSGDITVEYSGNTSSWATASGGGNSYTVTVKANSSQSARSGQIIFIDNKTGDSAKVDVSQKAASAPVPTKKPTSAPTPTNKVTPVPTSLTPTPRPKLAASPVSFSLSCDASTPKITFRNRVGDLTFQYVGSTNTWVTVGGGGDSYTLSVKSNTTMNSRSGQIVFVDPKTGDSVTISLTQEGGAKPTNTPVPTPTNTPTPTPTPRPKLAVDLVKPRLEFSNGSSSQTVTLLNRVGDITVEYGEKSSSWITAAGGGDKYTVTVKSNPYQSIRWGSVIFIDTKTGDSVEVEVKQKAAPSPTPTPTNTPTPTPVKLKAKPWDLRFDHTASTKTIKLLNVEGDIKIEYYRNCDSWLIAAGGGDTYAITVQENKKHESRNGSVFFIDTKTGKSTSVYVEQWPAPTATPTPEFDVRPGSLSFGCDTESRSVTLENVKGEISFEYSDGTSAWATVGGGGGHYTVTVRPNYDKDTRTGRIVFVDHATGQGAILYLYQKGGAVRPTPEPTKKLVPDQSKLEFTEAASSQDIQFENAVGEITVEFFKNTASWVHFAGHGNVYNVSVDRNDYFDDRSTQVVFLDRGSGQYFVVDILQKSIPAPEKMPVTFVHYGSMTEVVEQTPYKNFVLPNPMERHGYTFLGWYTHETAGEVVKPTDIVNRHIDKLYGHWRSDIAPKIKCYLNYPGAEGVYLDGYATIGEHYVLPKDINRDGYLFLGWYTEPVGGERIYSSMIVQQDDNIRKLYAHYKGKRVQLNFFVADEYGGTYGEKIDAYIEKYAYFGDLLSDYLPVVERPQNHHIIAWTDANDNYVTNGACITSTEPQNYHAVWGEWDCYTVVFDGNGSRSGGQFTRTYRFDALEDWPEKLFDNDTGLIYWSTTRSGYSGFVFDVRDKVYNVSNGAPFVTLYAIWRTGTVTYYDPFRGKSACVDELPHVFTPKGIKDIPQLEIPGLNFIGWTTKSKNMIGGPAEYGPNSEYVVDGKDITLYPVYEIEDENKILLVYYDPADKVKDITVLYVPVGTGAFIMPTETPNDEVHELEYWAQRDFILLNAGVRSIVPGKELELYNDVLIHPNLLVFEARWKYIPQELVLIYNGGFPTEHIVVETDEYTLPAPERDGFLFLGWSTDGKTPAYAGGSTYTVPKYGKTLYGVWDTLEFTVEYYDGISGKMLGKKEKATVVDSIEQVAIDIQGMSCYGWTDKKPSDSAWDLEWTKERLKRDKFYQTGDPMGSLPYKNGTVRLYSCYLQDKLKSGCVTVIYIPNGDVAAPTPGVFGKDEDIVVSKDKMQMSDRLFVKWKIVGKEYTGFQPGDTMNGFVDRKEKVVYLVACWVNKNNLKLDPNVTGAQKINLAADYFVGDKISTDDLEKMVSNPGSYVAGWKTTLSSKVYGPHEFISVPNQDMVITAIWRQPQYTIYYHNGFTDQVIGRSEVEGRATLNFNESDFPGIEPEGYTFIGWTKEWPRKRPWRVDKNDLITIAENDSFTIDKDIHVYSCYAENKSEYPDMVMVIYNPGGGIGGPGVEYYDPDKREEYCLSKNYPELAGFYPIGWTDEEGRRVTDEDYFIYAAEGVLRLYPIWQPRRANSEYKDQLQQEYGADIMRDYYFDTAYESSEWQKINDRTYFAIKTVKGGRSQYDYDLRTEVLIVEYENGKWVITKPRQSGQLEKRVEEWIVANNDDEPGEWIKLGSKLGFTALKNIPYVKWVVIAQELMGGIEDTINKLSIRSDVNENLKTVLVSGLLDKIYSIALEDELCLEVNTIAGFMEEITPVVVQAVDDVLGKNIFEYKGNLEKLKKLCNAGSEEEYLKLIQEVQTSFAETEGKILLQITEYCVRKSPDKFKKSSTPILNNKFDGKIAIDKISLTFSLLDWAWSSIFDYVNYSKRDKTMDPFGKQNAHLEAFQKSITEEQGFSQAIANDFRNMLLKIYKNYHRVD